MSKTIVSYSIRGEISSDFFSTEVILIKEGIKDHREDDVAALHVPAENDLRVGLAVFCRQFSVLAHDRRLRTISIGSCSPFPVMELMPSLQQFFAEKTILTELVDTDAHLLTRLKNRGYDLVILHSLPTDKALYCQRYMDEQIYLTVEENHPVANKKSISFAEMLVVCRASNQSKYRAIFNAVRGYALRH